MYLHREGNKILVVWGLFLAAIIVLTLLLASTWLIYTVIGICLMLFLLVAQFFRIPKRFFEAKASDVLCPADGKVVAIEKVTDKEYLKDERIQISVFMSPLNVHAQWSPVSGEVKYVKYHEGKYLVAWHPKSSEENERSTIVVGTGRHEVLFRQIAGAVARRICYYVEVGQKVAIGEEVGFIKFGSRVDILLPVESQVHCKIDDKVQGKKTILATLPS